MADTHRITLAHSPDADDMVMFWPLVGMRTPDGRPVDDPAGTPVIETGNFEFDLEAADIQALNRIAMHEARFDITAISAHAYPHMRKTYAITRCGASMGEGFGPKLISRADTDAKRLADDDVVVAVPGLNTTAFLALSLLLERQPQVCELPFDQVPDAVVSGRADFGLVIHEAQLTFESLGLKQVEDLGRWWSATRSLPLPLGLNVIKRDVADRFGPEAPTQISRMLEASIRHARDRADESHRFLLLHAGGRPEWRDRELVRRYLEMYVSPLTLDMGRDGVAALEALLGEGARAGFCPDPGAIDLV